MGEPREKAKYVRTGVGGITRRKKVSRGKAYEEVVIHIPRPVWESPEFPFMSRRTQVVVEIMDGGISVHAYDPSSPAKARRKKE